MPCAGYSGRSPGRTKWTDGGSGVWMLLRHDTVMRDDSSHPPTSARES